jgi:hypothetical protein
MWNAQQGKVPPAFQRGLRTILPNVQLGFTLRKRPKIARSAKRYMGSARLSFNPRQDFRRVSVGRIEF